MKRLTVFSTSVFDEDEEYEEVKGVEVDDDMLEEELEEELEETAGGFWSSSI